MLYGRYWEGYIVYDFELGSTRLGDGPVDIKVRYE